MSAYNAVTGFKRRRSKEKERAPYMTMGDHVQKLQPFQTSIIYILCCHHEEDGHHTLQSA